MRRYGDFFKELLLALYKDGREYRDLISFESLALNNEIEYVPGWLAEAQQELASQGYIRGPKPIAGDETAIGALTGSGMRFIEENYLNQEPLPPGLSRAGSIYVGEDDPPPGFGKDGDLFLQTAPAADRLVPLNHNEPEYREIAEGLETLREAVRQNNEVGDTTEERDRILRSLTAAQEFWAATELRVIQIKIGVIMAVEDASKALVRVGKSVGKKALVDLIVAYVKHKIGIDI